MCKRDLTVSGVLLCVPLERPIQGMARARSSSKAHLHTCTVLYIICWAHHFLHSLRAAPLVFDDIRQLVLGYVNIYLWLHCKKFSSKIILCSGVCLQGQASKGRWPSQT